MSAYAEQISAQIQQAVQRAHELAIEHGITLATAESLTGGDLAGTICTVSGASAYFMGGVVSYASSVKASVLGVSETLLAQAGSVDARVAQQMAAGAARVCGASYALSTTGVAGPEPHDGKPVGTVFIGLSSPEGVIAREYSFEGDRAAIRAQSVLSALTLLIESLSSQ